MPRARRGVGGSRGIEKVGPYPVDVDVGGNRQRAWCGSCEGRTNRFDGDGSGWLAFFKMPACVVSFVHAFMYHLSGRGCSCGAVGRRLTGVALRLILSKQIVAEHFVFPRLPSRVQRHPTRLQTVGTLDWNLPSSTRLKVSLHGCNPFSRRRNCPLAACSLFFSRSRIPNQAMAQPAARAGNHAADLLRGVLLKAHTVWPTTRPPMMVLNIYSRVPAFDLSTSRFSRRWLSCVL